MRRVYVSTYTIYIDIYVLYVHMYMTNWKIGCALLVYWDFHLAKSNLCRGELLRCYRLTSWAAAILERRRDESIIPAAVLERRRRDESIIPVGKSHFGMVKSIAIFNQKWFGKYMKLEFSRPKITIDLGCTLWATQMEESGAQFRQVSRWGQAWVCWKRE